MDGYTLLSVQTHTEWYQLILMISQKYNWLIAKFELIFVIFLNTCDCILVDDNWKFYVTRMKKNQ